MEKMKFVFISHSNAPDDAVICERLYSYLTGRGICCWMDREDMRTDSWEAQLTAKIIDASAFILVASRNSLTSLPVQREIRLMDRANKPIIPLALDDYILQMDAEQGSALFVLGAGSLQTVFYNRFPSEEQAFDRLINYLPHDVSRLDNNPADFVLDETNTVLKRYDGHDAFVVVPEFVREIADSAFQNKRELMKISIPDSVEKIGKRAFFGCSALKQVDGMAGVRSIDASAFTCSAMEQPDFYVINGALFGDALGELPSARVISCNAFFGCTAEELVFPDGLTVIGEGAFANSYKLRRVTFPASLIHIDNRAFSGCGKLKEVIFKGKAPQNAGEIFKQATITEEK